MNDTELIARAREGSADAFCTLIAGYRDRLFRFLLARCHTRADAEDALQEAFLNAYRYIATYDDKWRFSTWLYRIAIRQLAGLHRSRENPRMIDDGATEPDPLETATRESDRDNLWLTARDSLSDDQFHCLWLHYAEDMSVNDVAHAMGRTVSWTKVSLFRARRRLKVALDSDDASAVTAVRSVADG